MKQEVFNITSSMDKTITLYDRNKFRERFRPVIINVYEHLAAIYYTKDVNSDYKPFIDHWKTEIIGWLYPFCDDTLKGNDSPKARKCALMQEINDKELIYGDPLETMKGARGFLKTKENMTFSDEQWIKIFNTISALWGKIVDCIAIKDASELTKLIQEL